MQYCNAASVASAHAHLAGRGVSECKLLVGLVLAKGVKRENIRSSDDDARWAQRQQRQSLAEGHRPEDKAESQQAGAEQGAPCWQPRAVENAGGDTHANAKTPTYGGSSDPVALLSCAKTVNKRCGLAQAHSLHSHAGMVDLGGGVEGAGIEADWAVREVAVVTHFERQEWQECKACKQAADEGDIHAAAAASAYATPVMTVFDEDRLVSLLGEWGGLDGAEEQDASAGYDDAALVFVKGLLRRGKRPRTRIFIELENSLLASSRHAISNGLHALLLHLVRAAHAHQDLARHFFASTKRSIEVVLVCMGVRARLCALARVHGCTRPSVMMKKRTRRQVLERLESCLRVLGKANATAASEGTGACLYLSYLTHVATYMEHQLPVAGAAGGGSCGFFRRLLACCCPGAAGERLHAASDAAHEGEHRSVDLGTHAETKAQVAKLALRLMRVGMAAVGALHMDGPVAIEGTHAWTRAGDVLRRVLHALLCAAWDCARFAEDMRQLLARETVLAASGSCAANLRLLWIFVSPAGARGTAGRGSSAEVLQLLDSMLCSMFVLDQGGKGLQAPPSWDKLVRVYQHLVVPLDAEVEHDQLCIHDSGGEEEDEDDEAAAAEEDEDEEVEGPSALRIGGKESGVASGRVKGLKRKRKQAGSQRGRGAAGTSQVVRSVWCLCLSAGGAHSCDTCMRCRSF